MPTFVIADDDIESAGKIIEGLTVDWDFIPVAHYPRVVRFARDFPTTAVLLADRMHYPRGGAEMLLQDLLDQAETQVVILAELWDSEVAESWRRKGALDCIPHPTRTGARMEKLRAKLQEIILAGLPAPETDPEIGSEEE